MKRSLVQSIPVVEPHGQIEGVRVGKIVSIDEDGGVFVNYTGNSFGPISARFVSSVKLEALRQAVFSCQDVLLVFENNDPLLPVIIDRISSLVDKIVQREDIDLKIDEPKDVTIEGERITFDAKEQVVLKCGKASITLTRAGKVLIRGAYLLNRSSGANRIKGGSVQIN